MSKRNYRWRFNSPSKTLRHYRDSPFGSPNTAYTAYSVRPNFAFAETSYMLGTLYEMPEPAFKNEEVEIDV
jgi:hypothetical protein